MVKEGFNKFCWGFLFIMFDFRIQGFDILPDVIGAILFAMGFAALAEYSLYFAKGKSFNLIMIIVSVLSIYEKPVQGGGIHVDLFGIVVGLASTVVILVVVYHLMMGIRDMASKQQRFDLEKEAEQKWTYFLALQIAALFLFVLIFVPPLFILMVIGLFLASLVLMVVLMRFMTRCGEELSI